MGMERTEVDGVTMKPERSDRGFEYVFYPTYLDEDSEHSRLVAQSSAIGDYGDSFDRPGSSYLWIGRYHHLNRDEVREFVGLLNLWLETGSLERREHGDSKP